MCLKAKAELRKSDPSRFRATLPGVLSRLFPDSVNLTAAVVHDQRPLRVAVMSAAAPGTSKAAHSDVAPKKKKGPGALATAYLVIYNVVMTAGYVACFLVLMLLLLCVYVCSCVHVRARAVLSKSGLNNGSKISPL